MMITKQQKYSFVADLSSLCTKHGLYLECESVKIEKLDSYKQEVAVDMYAVTGCKQCGGGVLDRTGTFLISALEKKDD
jgi:hypothetical protein